MIAITATEEWRAVHPGAMIGLLEISGVDNTKPSAALNQHKRDTEACLREQYAGYTRADFLALPVMAGYNRYYRRFDKTYHVLLQVESIVLKGKSLPDVSPLVDANFISEVATFVATAGHDADMLVQPVWIDVSRANEVMTQMGGKPKAIQAGDMVMRDWAGLCCSIMYGQDNRSPIKVETRHGLYVAYAPDGVPQDAVEAHLAQVEANIRLFAPDAIVEQRRVLRA